MKEEIARAAEILDSEFQQYCEEVHKELKAEAPRTTPDFSNTEYRWGESEYEAAAAGVTEGGSRVDHATFLEVMMALYLGKEGFSIDKIGYNRINKSDTELVWKNLSGKGGSSLAGRNLIYIGSVPHSLRKVMSDSINANLSSKAAKQLSVFPTSYSKASVLFGRNREEFKELIAHELTHYYANFNTDIGELQREGFEYSYEDISADEFVKNLRSDAKSVREQAQEVSTGEDISAIEEIFSYFVSYYYTGNKSAINDSLYEKSEYIDWGRNIVIEKFNMENPENPVDWARAELKRVLDRVAQKGMLKQNGEKRNLITLFLYEMMPEEDLKRIQEIKSICEGDLARAFSDLEQAIEDIEEYESGRDPRVLKEFREFQQEVDWDNPRELEDVLAHRILRKAAPERSLHETHNIIRTQIAQEIDRLDDMVQIAANLGQELGDTEERRELKKAAQEIRSIESELKSLYS